MHSMHSMHRLSFPYYHCSSQQSWLPSYLFQQRKFLSLLLLPLSREISKILQLQSTYASLSLYILFFCGVCNIIFYFFQLRISVHMDWTELNCSELLLFPVIHSHRLLQIQIPLAFGVGLIHGFCWNWNPPWFCTAVLIPYHLSRPVASQSTQRSGWCGRLLSPLGISQIFQLFKVGEPAGTLSMNTVISPPLMLLGIPHHTHDLEGKIQVFRLVNPCWESVWDVAHFSTGEQSHPLLPWGRIWCSCAWKGSSHQPLLWQCPVLTIKNHLLFCPLQWFTHTGANAADRLLLLSTDLKPLLGEHGLHHRCQQRGLGTSQPTPWGLRQQNSFLRPANNYAAANQCLAPWWDRAAHNSHIHSTATRPRASAALPHSEAWNQVL